MRVPYLAVFAAAATTVAAAATCIPVQQHEEETSMIKAIFAANANLTSTWATRHQPHDQNSSSLIPRATLSPRYGAGYREAIVKLGAAIEVILNDLQADEYLDKKLHVTPTMEEHLRSVHQANQQYVTMRKIEDMYEGKEADEEWTIWKAVQEAKESECQQENKKLWNDVKHLRVAVAGYQLAWCQRTFDCPDKKHWGG